MEPMPNKRPRTSMKESSADGEEEHADLEPSQGTDIGDECPPRALFTREERVAGSVEKYSDMFSELLDQLHSREQMEVFQRDGVDLFTVSDIKTLLQSLKVMRKGDLIRKVDPDLLITLMKALDKQVLELPEVLHGIGLDVLGAMVLSNDDDGWRSSGIDARLIAHLQLCLDVGICELIVLSTREIDRRVLSEEMIDSCIQLFNHIIHRLIVPCIDSTRAIAASHPEETATRQETHSDQSKSQLQRRKKYLNIKTNRDLRKAIDRLVPVVCEFIEQLSKLVLTVKLADRWILHFSSSMTELFLLEHSSFAISLQQSAVAVLRGIFLQYKAHRPLMLDEVVAIMVKLPTSKRTLRTVKLLDSDHSIQMISTLVVALIQSSASIDGVENEGAESRATQDPTLMSSDNLEEGPESEKKKFARCLEETQQNTRLFTAALVRECFKKHDERDHRVVLENFVEDLLVMFVRPEWAGAEVLLEALSSSLASILHANMTKDSKKLESQHTVTALNLIGKICTSIKTCQNVAAREILEDDMDARSVLAEHARHLNKIIPEAKFDSDEDLLRLDDNNKMLLKHAVMVFMRRSNRSNIAQADSRRLLLARFISESCTSHDAKRDDSAETSLWKTFWDTNPGRVSKIAPPSGGLSLKLSLHLAISREFCCLFDKLLAHVMSLLSKGIPTFRARVLKVLAGIVDVDPMLMAERGVREAVQQCFLDESTSVRQAAVDLVGRYVTLQPLLFDRYFDILAERLRDKGISVRKSVCKTFRAFLISASHVKDGEDSISEEELRRKSACMRSLVERIGDPSEETLVKNFIIDTFQEVWFGSELSARQLSNDFVDELPTEELPPGWKSVESTSMNNESAPQSSTKRVRILEFLSPDGKVYSSRDQAWSAYRTPQVTPSSIVESKRSKQDDVRQMVVTIVEVIHDMPNLDWFVALLRRLLHEDDQEEMSKSGARFNRDRSDEVKVAQARSEKIVECLTNCLWQLEEGEPLKGVTIGDIQMQFLSCMETLSAFCEAQPMLLHQYLELIMVHLVGDDKLEKGVENKVQSLVLSMVNNVFSQMERIPPRLVKRLEDDLRTLVFRAPPSVVGPSIKCLATISTSTRKPPVLLMKLLEVFYSYLLKYKELDSLANIGPDASSSLQRALFTAGQVGGTLDLDTYDLQINETAKLKKGAIMESLYETFARFLRMEGDTACSAKAVQGLGFLFLTRPRLLLQAQQDNILEFLLADSPDEMKLQCLASLRELLRHEEQRLEHGVATKKMNTAKSKSEQVQGDQEADAALIGSVMQAQLQNILVLSLQKPVRIRTEAVTCTSTLLTQGLVSPVHCIPNLVALETDQVISIRDLAHSQLVALHEKFPMLLNAPSIQGIFLSHSFQLNAFGTSSVYTKDKHKHEYCLFGRLYSNCIRTGKAQRNMFLKALVNQFSGSGNMLGNTNAKPSSPVTMGSTLQYLCYLAQLISALPYELEDEPLYIIYLINRVVTLKLGSTLDNIKELLANAGAPSDIMEDEDTNFSDVDIVDYLPTIQPTKGDAGRLQTECCVAFALENEKCMTYQPGNSSKATEQPTMLSGRISKLKVPSLPEAEDPVEWSWHLFVHAWEAARDDQHQMDFEAQEDVAMMNSSGKTRRRKGGRRRKSVQSKHVESTDDDDDDDVEFVEGFAE
ncbi:Nipped-b protein, partial [Globisporangium splendens]